MTERRLHPRVFRKPHLSELGKEVDRKVSLGQVMNLGQQETLLLGVKLPLAGLIGVSLNEATRKKTRLPHHSHTAPVNA